MCHDSRSRSFVCGQRLAVSLAFPLLSLFMLLYLSPAFSTATFFICEKRQKSERNIFILIVDSWKECILINKKKNFFPVNFMFRLQCIPDVSRCLYLGASMYLQHWMIVCVNRCCLRILCVPIQIEFVFIATLFSLMFDVNEPTNDKMSNKFRCGIDCVPRCEPNEHQYQFVFIYSERDAFL